MNIECLENVTIHSKFLKVAQSYLFVPPNESGQKSNKILIQNVSNLTRFHFMLKYDIDFGLSTTLAEQSTHGEKEDHRHYKRTRSQVYHHTMSFTISCRKSLSQRRLSFISSPFCYHLILGRFVYYRISGRYKSLIKPLIVDPFGESYTQIKARSRAGDLHTINAKQRYVQQTPFPANHVNATVQKNCFTLWQQERSRK